MSTRFDRVIENLCHGDTLMFLMFPRDGTSHFIFVLSETKCTRGVYINRIGSKLCETFISTIRNCLNGFNLGCKLSITSSKVIK